MGRIATSAVPAVPKARLLAIDVAEIVQGGVAPELPVVEQVDDVLLRLQVERLDRTVGKIDEDLEGVALVPRHTTTAELPLCYLSMAGGDGED